MKKISIDDLISNESYNSQRSTIRKVMIEHKANRRVNLGPNVTLHFEDYQTMRYQVQELMRAEKICQFDAIREELAIYNPLIPDGKNLKVTFMIEYPDENERREKLAKLLGIEEAISIKIGDNERVYPIANEDLERSTDQKTAAVHFLRFEFSDKAITAAKQKANWSISCEHENYLHTLTVVPESIRESLTKDFD